MSDASQKLSGLGLDPEKALTDWLKSDNKLRAKGCRWLQCQFSFLDHHLLLPCSLCPSSITLSILLLCVLSSYFLSCWTKGCVFPCISTMDSNITPGLRMYAVCSMHTSYVCSMQERHSGTTFISFARGFWGSGLEIITVFLHLLRSSLQIGIAWGPHREEQSLAEDRIGIVASSRIHWPKHHRMPSSCLLWFKYGLSPSKLIPEFNP